MSEYKNIACPYCRAEKTYPVFHREWRRFLKCPGCSLIFLHPYDRQDDDYSHHYSERWGNEWRGIGREAIFSEAISMLPRTAGGALLDVGCGGGQLLSIAAQKGWDVWGVDVSMEAHSWVCEDVRARIMPSLDSLPQDICFSAVCSINVLDQVHKPWKILKQIAEKMEQGSCFVIRLPNCRLYRIIHQAANMLPSSLGRYLLSWTIMHEYCMESDFLKRFLADAGFEHVSMIDSIASSGDVYGQGSVFLLFKRFLSFVLLSLYRLSCGKILLTPSVLVIAYRQKMA